MAEVLDSLTSMNLAYGRGYLHAMRVDEDYDDDMLLGLRADITNKGFTDQYHAGVSSARRQVPDILELWHAE